MLRYAQALGVAAAEVETKRMQNWSASQGAEVFEHNRVTISDAQGVKAMYGQMRRVEV